MSTSRLLIFGATDAAAELCHLAARAGWLVAVSDPRPGEADPGRFPDARVVLHGGPDEAIEAVGGIDADTAVALMTHDEDVERGVLEPALRSDAAFVGAMGSRKMQDIRRERLAAAGFTEVELERLSGPIGLDIGAREPTDTAVSILAELIAVRNGRSGGRLARTAGPIRGEAAVTGAVVVVLAAGGATRFGGPKQLAELDGRPLLQHVLDTVADRPSVLVLGARAEEIGAAVDPGGARVVICSDWADGMAASLRAGLDAVGAADWAVVVLGDQPGLTRAAIDAVLAAARPGDEAVRATFAGRPGHPVALHASAFARVRGARGDVGARDVLQQLTVRTVEVGHLCSGVDVDTPADLEAIRS